MATYKNGFDVKTGEPMNPPNKDWVPAMPMLMKGMPEYQSPVDGRVINSRQERKDDLKRNNCVEFEPSMSPTKGKFKNKSFTEKRGLKVSPEFKE